MRNTSGCFRPDCTRPTCRMSGDDPRHGTDNGYMNLGCGCLECRAANTEWLREAKQRRISRSTPDHVHGTANGYGNYACRCDDCRTAWAANRRRERSNRSTF